jgi:ribosomal-protein-alanine N-acetyltransferase
MSPALRALTAGDAPAAAALHALCFPDPWSEAAFAAQLAAPGAVSLGRYEGSELIAFALFQRAGEEADLLTLATHPARRGEGLATQLLSGLIAALAAGGVHRATLDVAADNLAGLRVYRRLGFTEDGRRPRYYTVGRQAPADAVLMSRALAG